MTVMRPMGRAVVRVVGALGGMVEGEAPSGQIHPWPGKESEALLEIT